MTEDEFEGRALALAEKLLETIGAHEDGDRPGMVARALGYALGAVVCASTPEPGRQVALLHAHRAGLEGTFGAARRYGKALGKA
jgi:hypothetical protein